jgi:hypothetical protein
VTNDDIDVINGEREKLIGKIQGQLMTCHSVTFPDLSGTQIKDHLHGGDPLFLYDMSKHLERQNIGS